MIDETSDRTGVPVRGPVCRRCAALEARIQELRSELARRPYNPHNWGPEDIGMERLPVSKYMAYFSTDDVPLWKEATDE